MSRRGGKARNAEVRRGTQRRTRSGRRLPPPARVAELETPAPLVDLDRLTRNLDRMAAYAAEHRLTLRPHIKTHKSPRVAAEQLRRGAAGLTCATVREAEVMAEVAD